MAIKSREEIMETLRTRIGEDTSDDALSFIEDVQDTLDSLSNADNENWKQRYEDNDAQWRQKYRDRFFSNEPIGDNGMPGNNVPPEDSSENLTYENLFKEDK